MKRLLLSLYLILAGFSVALAQIDFGSLEEEQIFRPDSKYNTWSVTFGYGPVIYYTDIVDYTFFPSSQLKLGPSVQIAKQLGRSWALEGEFLMADMYGQKYNRYFEGDFREASLNVKAYFNQLIFNGPLRDRLNIYGKIGLGVNFFRSTMREQGTDRLLRVNEIFGGGGYPNSYSDWDPDDFLVMGYKRNGYASADPDLEEIARESGLVVPIALGFRYRINKSFDIGVETALHNMVADNMDVDMTGADNDSYMHTAVSVTYKFGKKDKRHASWTYKDFNLSYERDRMRDPLAHKLDSLRAHLDQLAAAHDSVVSDTTYISKDKTIRRELFSASVFFDFDKSEISPRSHRTLAGVARYMREHPEAVIKIQGYTDDVGSFEYNKKLSERRCLAVKDVLVKDYGVDASSFVIESKGKTELLSDTRRLAPRGVHLVNRRVDIFQVTK